MKEISIRELQETAKICNQNKHSWHIHLLTPDCDFNKRKDKHAFILENRTKDETHVTYSSKRLLKVGQSLAKMLFGEEILKSVSKKSGIRNKTTQKIIQRAKDLNKKNMLWHHHILFPDCIFNKHSKKWKIVFEDKEKYQVLEALYDKKPLEDLRELEILYYKQKE